MRHYFLCLCLLLLPLALIGCKNYRSLNRVTMNFDLTREAWMNEVDTNPRQWMHGADSWFINGAPNKTEVSSKNAPYSAAISTLNVRVPNFSKIKIKGDFQVQLFGTDGRNSVYVYGANDSVRGVSVQVKGNTLCLEQTVKPSMGMRRVIVRIGINHIQEIVHSGKGCVEAVHLRGACLTIFSNGPGNMYLSGDINVRRIFKSGAGNVSIFGANTPVLDIKATGMGCVNVSGNVGVKTIINQGRTNVNIIGANTNSLRIFAKGRSKVGIAGLANVHEIKASDFARVYVNQIAGPGLHVFATGRAKVGLAGSINNIYIDACKQTCILAKNVCATAAYVRSHDAAHINIAGNKIFAAATEASSIYFFGTPAVVSQFVSGNAVIVPIWSPAAFCAADIRPVVPVYIKPATSVRHKRPRMLPGEG